MQTKLQMQHICIHWHYKHEPDAKATNAPGVNIDVTIHITKKYTHAGKHMQILDDYKTTYVETAEGF